MTLFDRNHPAYATIDERYPLTGPGSSKCTFHIRLKLQGIKPHFKPGDSIGILAHNDLSLVQALLQTLGYSGLEQVSDPRKQECLTLHDYLLKRANLARLTPSLVSLAGATLPAAREEQKNFLSNSDPLFFLQQQRVKALPLDKLSSCFGPLLPRFYSIASSSLVHPEMIDLTVAVLSYQVGSALRQGVASHFLCFQAQLHQTLIPFYVQPARHFALPENLNAPLIMIGPGTGIAPFRAFIQERLHLKSPGAHWLFFGERQQEHDFFYKEDLLSLVEKKQLRLSTAFSRDCNPIVYVQHAMEREGKDLFQWLEEGGYFYICGDAKKMARDVDHTLHQLIERYGNYSEVGAQEYVKSLKTNGRYLTDVY